MACLRAGVRLLLGGLHVVDGGRGLEVGDVDAVIRSGQRERRGDGDVLAGVDLRSDFFDEGVLRDVGDAGDGDDLLLLVLRECFFAFEAPPRARERDPAAPPRLWLYSVARRWSGPPTVR